MEHEIPSQSQLRTRPRRTLVALGAAVFLALSAVAVLRWRTSVREEVRSPRIDSPYENTRIGVKYVGDSACVSCHAEISETYRRHPMGRSLLPIETAPTVGGDPKAGQPYFEAQGLEYTVENQDGHTLHRETRRDASGRIVAQNQAEIRYVVGSGRQAYSFLIERDGFLFESPITWYAGERRWGLSPNYELRNYHFERPIISECLFCHSNRYERVTAANNRYRRPIFQGHAIGCERCHGPGELHVRAPKTSGGRDVTVVNPANLEPSLRDAVCEQCHLIGPRRVVRADVRSEDYRPGLPFYRFWSLFVPAAGPGANKFAGQTEQMHESECFRASAGALGCISCHDPHVLPQAQEKAAYFRDRCLQCHGEKGCSLPAKVRLERGRGDDCTGCHMPRSESSNNPHVATTNHRIPRRQDGWPEPPLTDVDEKRPGPSIVNFHRALMDEQDRALSERERGIALCREGRTSGAREALPLLEAALAARPHDPPAWEAKGEVLGRFGRAAEGLAAYQMAVKIDPTRQTSLEGAAYLAAASGRNTDAITYWRKAMAINPWRSDYYAELAKVELQLRDFGAAADACREALRLNPFHLEVRKWLVRSYVHLGQREAAREELATLLGFNPPDREELLRWLGPQ